MNEGNKISVTFAGTPMRPGFIPSLGESLHKLYDVMISKGWHLHLVRVRITAEIIQRKKDADAS